MDYADYVARLGRTQLNTGPSVAPAPTKEKIKGLLQSYISAAGSRKKATNTHIKAPKQANPLNRFHQNVLLIKDNETPAESLNRLGRTLIQRKEVFTKEEAVLFIRGDLQLGRMGLVQLAGVDDVALRSAAISLLDELLLNDEIEHPSRDAFTEAFVSVGFNHLAKDLCLDLHVLNEDTRGAAFRVALAVGVGNNELLPTLFRNQRAALDLYMRWMNDMDESDDEASSVQTGDEERPTTRNQVPVVMEDVGAKTWDEVGGSVEEDDDYGEFDGARLKGAMYLTGLSTSSFTSADSDLQYTPRERQAETTGHLEDWDPLRIKLRSAASFAGKKKVSKYVADPESLLEKLYPSTTRAELAKGLAFLDRELFSREATEQKLVHDRLIDLVKVRQTVDTFAASNELGSTFAKKASASLKTAKNVSDISLGPLLAREDIIAQTKKALQLATERGASQFMLDFSKTLDNLVKQKQFAEAVALVRRYVEDETERNQRMNLSGSMEAQLPVLFHKAKGMNDGAIRSFVQTIERQVDSSPTVEAIRVFIDLRELVPTSFAPRASPAAMKSGLPEGEDEDSLRDTDQLLISIAAAKAEKTCGLLNARYEQTASDLAERSSRAKIAVLDLNTNFRAELEPDSIPANVMARYKTVRAAGERYSSCALSVINQCIKITLDFLTWSAPFDRFGLDLDRARAQVVEACVEILNTAIFDSAPPNLPGETSVVLSVAKLGESLWANSLNVTMGGRTVASSESSSHTSGSQISSQYRSFLQTATHGNLPWYATGVLDMFTKLNLLGQNTHPGFLNIGKKVTELTLDYVLDELAAMLDCLSKNVQSMGIEQLIPDSAAMVGDVEKDDEGKRFCIPLIDSSWALINNILQTTVEPLVESCGSRAQSTQEALQVKDRVTKAARCLGTMLGRCAEQYRARGNDPSGKGFLLLARDCHILKEKILKELQFADNADLQAQFERLEPALATQYLKACAGYLSEKVQDALAGPKDPLIGLRYSGAENYHHHMGDNFGDAPVEVLMANERWVGILHTIAECVGECESFLGWRYAGKLKTGLARAVGTRALAYIESEINHLDPVRRRGLEVDIAFVDRALRAKGDDLGFTKALQMLKDRSGALGEYELESGIEVSMKRWSWISECFIRL